MKIAMKPIVEMDGDEMTRILWRQIKETLLEALDAGIGRETVRVEASEKAIAEANSALPAELRLHVMARHQISDLWYRDRWYGAPSHHTD